MTTTAAGDPAILPFLDSVVDVVHDGVVACDAQGRLIVVNRAARLMHGVGPDDDVDPLDWMERTDLRTADGSRLLEISEIPLVRALHGESVPSYDLLITPPDGRRHRVTCSARPILDESGALLGAVATLHASGERSHGEPCRRHDNLHDLLTGLPNRALLAHRLEHAIAGFQRDPKHQFALMVLDLDDFKHINEGNGHLIGDQLLQEIARRLVRVLRATDAVTRLGGDEFAILLEAPCDETVVMRVCDRIQTAVRKPIEIGDHTLHVTASIGATLSNAHYHSPDDPMRDADTAMYRAKQSGKNHVALFDLSMSAAVRERISTERDLRVALQREDQMVLHYQPIIDLETGRCTGFEALARWRHPTRGLLPPAAFLEIAESTNLIVPLGNWALREAARQLSEWQQIKELADLEMAVNLSGKQLTSKHQPEEHLLGFAFPHGLELEVTESTLTDSPEAVATLAELAGRGVRLSLDDFGTGFASLDAVQRHPISTLKIDRSFVAQLPEGARQRAIIASVSTLAQHLGLRIVAEGLETRAQVQAVLSMGCRYGQGYFFSRPVPAPDALNFALKANGIA